ncbi:hypothetical protein [Cellulomonas bogoriensis]|uniref:Uncharacterized protein n=1 Tax=Cellulomonas bogoriensis 69B4 = DSM 16987 TaxID=1386082 RepID=A0A0A0BR28_9CELL|nr:hypothetical protein [Cellulomonas bogoriensis]KGM09554.1 hypothetical protein N869_05645 [Cellulomonas bogoriensis 69B4 = DSM 16987]
MSDRGVEEQGYERPAVELGLGPVLPGRVVRVLPVVMMVLASLVVLEFGWPVAWVVVAGLAAGAVLRPHLPLAAVHAVLLGLWSFGSPDLLDRTSGAGAGVVRAAALVLLVHLAVRLSALARHVTWRSVVEVAVLTRVLRSVMVVQVPAQLMLLGVVWLRGGLGDPAGDQGWLRLWAMVAVLVVAALTVPRWWRVRRVKRVPPDERPVQD